MIAPEKQVAGKCQKKIIAVAIMDQIISIVNTTFHGNVALVFQDCRLVQIERNEKIRPFDPSSANQHLSKSTTEKSDLPTVRVKIQEAFEKLEYGQIVIVIKEGKIIQIDRTEKQRFSAMVGIYGDGI